MRSLTIRVDLTSDKAPATRTLSFVKEGCQLYFCAQHLLLELSAQERGFFDHLCEHMDKKNRIIVDEKRKQQYANFVDKVTQGNKKLNPKSLDKSLKKLTSLGLLLKKDKAPNAYYIVNPRYVFKGSEKERKSLLKSLIEERFTNGLPIEPLVNIPVKELLDEVK